MDGKTLYRMAILQATGVIRKVRGLQLTLATPDTEWDVRTLAGHMLYELLWVPDMLSGSTITQVGSVYEGELIGSGEELTGTWITAVSKAEGAIEAADPNDTAHLSYRDASVDEYLQEAGSDQLIHSWDLGVAIGQKVQFDADIAQAVYERTLPDEASMSATGLFAEPLRVAENADIQAKLLALFGRDTNWLPKLVAKA